MGYRRRFNDRLLMFLLRVRDPADYAPLGELGAWSQIRPVENGPATLATALEALDRDALPPPAPPAPLAERATLAGPDPQNAAHTCQLRQLKGAEPAPAPCALPPGTSKDRPS